jgi:transposase
MGIWDEEQMKELNMAMRTHPVPHIRSKATALWNLGRGKSRSEVAEFMGVYRHAILRWKRRYEAHGLAGLEIEEGRGRPSRVSEEEVREAISQSPRNFGLQEERWTLSGLRSAVPSLRQFRSLRSVGYVLERMGLAPKRGQYKRSSPDPEYQKKKNMRSNASGKRLKIRKKS